MAEPSSSELQRSPLHDAHVELGARLVPFAGWEMPVQYEGIMQEHKAVRMSSGAFDISHMGQVFVRGANAGAWLNSMLTNDLSELGDGDGQYTLMLNEAGGVIDDLILYRMAEDEFFLVVNASMRVEDLAWLAQHIGPGVEIEDVSEAYAGLAVQGPDAVATIHTATEGALDEAPPRNGIVTFPMAGGIGIVCRTGYTGEDGYEIFCPAEAAVSVFKALLDAGTIPCGLGARDTLRLEMAYPLNGNDLAPDKTPIEAGLKFFVAMEKEGGFIGLDSLQKQVDEGLPSRLVAIRMKGKTPPIRPGYPVLEDGAEIGTLASGTLSPTLGEGIGLAYLPTAHAKRGTELEVSVRGTGFPAEVVKKPFVTGGR